MPVDFWMHSFRNDIRKTVIVAVNIRECRHGGPWPCQRLYFSYYERTMIIHFNLRRWDWIMATGRCRCIVSRDYVTWGRSRLLFVGLFKLPYSISPLPTNPHISGAQSGPVVLCRHRSGCRIRAISTLVAQRCEWPVASSRTMCWDYHGSRSTANLWIFSKI